MLKKINNCLPARSARKEGTRVWENPIEKKHEDQNTANLVLLEKKLFSEIIFYVRYFCAGKEFSQEKGTTVNKCQKIPINVI